MTRSAAWAAGPSFAPQQHQRNFDRDDNQYAIADRRERDREAGYGGDRGAPAFTPANDVLYTNKEDAEAAFAKLLKRIGVQSDWSWLQTVRVGVKDAQWRAIADPKEREDAFRKYCEELRAQDKAKEQGRQAKVRLDFTAMLRSHPEIKHYTRWQTALPLIEGETVYRSARDDSERRALFEEYIVSLKQSHTEQEAESKKTALDELMSLLQTLDLEPFTRWHTAEEKLEKTKEFDTGVFKPLHKMDIIETFGQHIRQLQKDTNDRVQAERRAKYRVERKNREAYAQLLSELQANGKLKAATKWKEIHEYIRDDPRYLGMLGQSGSTPLDLFWDALEQEDGKFRTQRRYALEVLQVRLLHWFTM
jgi:pre-mRNA-processing factor 40